MSTHQSKLNWYVRVLLAVLSLGSLAVFMGMQLFPAMPMMLLMLYLFVVLAGLLLVMSGLIILSLTFRQFILRHGGTDTQWFWFSSEPRGLVRLRELAKRTR